MNQTRTRTRISGRRLAAAVLTLSTVTAVTGTLVTAPAFAAVPMAVTGSAAVSAEAALPVDADVASTGTTGYVTSRKDELGNTVMEWRTYADGSVTPLSGTVGHDSYSDIAVTSNGGGSVWQRDMRPGGTLYTYFDLYSVFGAPAKLVGAVGESLYVSVSTGSEGYQDLYKLARVNGFAQKSKLNSRTRNTDYKVVASDGIELLILGAEMSRSSPYGQYEPSWWSARTTALSNSIVDWEGSGGAPRWTPSTTGASSATREAWVHYPTTGDPVIITNSVARFPLTGSMSGAVVAGVVGDVLLYGVPGTAGGESPSPLYARSLADPTAAPYELLDNFSSAAHAPDGSVLVRGSGAAGDGAFRIEGGAGGARPAVTLAADTGRFVAVQVSESKVPGAADLEKPGTTVPMEWTLNRADADLDLTLTHHRTGKKLTQRLPRPASGTRFTYAWNGILGGASAPNGDYSWSVTATPADGFGAPATAQGIFQVVRKANPHDLSDNGSADIVARDASGGLWRDDTFDWPVTGQIKTSGRTKIGTGWGIYNQIEAAGNLAGGPAGDFVARDTAGVLWSYLGTGNGTLAARTKIGSGWGVYNKIAAGSDLTGDGRPDLLATDTSGVLWLYKATGNWQAPYAARVKAGTGWNIYNQITAVGNTAGASAGDLLTRDTSGVLWLHLGKGDGTFAPRVRVGAGWGAFSQLVGAGDLNGDGRADLIGYGSGGTWAYLGTGNTTAPFTRVTTDLYAGEGTKFNSVS
ncbi:FG-GAP repeat domain-containing protein [Streptomyces exfoliatus]|uniref:FG-GAP repeat domain-containing protein n=1 Tax=Streptomyces exfoliatus TaxID=1905 RepID=UPI003C2FCA54